jgi:casein kinase II subunit beta
MDLYGLIHSRFVLSPKGLALMREKYLLGTFGTCQRVLCERQLVLPIGLSEELSTSRVKVISNNIMLIIIARHIAQDVKKCMCQDKSI